MSKKVSLFSVMCFLAVSVGCYDPHAQGSKIVREVEAAGAGDLSTFSRPGLSMWFANHPAVALRVADECKPLYATAPANWLTSAEGTVCTTARQNLPMPHFTADPRRW